jgi:hypothetical protein
MDKITESLKNLIPQDQLVEVASAVKEMLSSAKEEIEKEYNSNLEEAYQQLTTDLEKAEKTAYTGYQEAYEIITDLRNRLESQKDEFDKSLEEGYEEAYQMLLNERSKNKDIETSLYEEYDSKLAEMKEYIVEKVDQFLQQKGSEIYEQAKTDILSDPSLVEHKVVLNKIVDLTSDYIKNEDVSFVTTNKINESNKNVEELRGQLRILEARSIRLSTENTKLNETVKKFNSMVNESRNNNTLESKTSKVKKAQIVSEQNERVEKVKNASGRGHINTDNVQVIAEYNSGNGVNNELLVLSGVKKSN